MLFLGFAVLYLHILCCLHVEILHWEEDLRLTLSGGICLEGVEEEAGDSNTTSARRHRKKGMCSYGGDTMWWQPPGAGDAWGDAFLPGHSYVLTPPQAVWPRATSVKA